LKKRPAAGGSEIFPPPLGALATDVKEKGVSQRGGIFFPKGILSPKKKGVFPKRGGFFPRPKKKNAAIPNKAL